MSFYIEILDNFDFLFKEFDFKIEGYNSDAELSDFIVIAVGKKISLKFIKDRADFFLDISSNSTPEKWVSFYKILGKLKQDKLINIDFKPSNRSNNIRNYLRLSIEAIIKNCNNLF